MYCLRSYIPLLLLPIPLSLSPVHLTILLSLTYILNRPCIYCSLLLVILFASSCHWSGRCLIDFSYKSLEEGGAGIATWWLPRLYTMEFTGSTNATSLNETLAGFVSEVANHSVSGVADTVRNRLESTLSHDSTQKGIGWGTTWLGNLWSSREWTLPCLGTKLVL